MLALEPADNQSSMSQKWAGTLFVFHTSKIVLLTIAGVAVRPSGSRVWGLKYLPERVHRVMGGSVPRE